MAFGDRTLSPNSDRAVGDLSRDLQAGYHSITMFAYITIRFEFGWYSRVPTQRECP